MNVKINDKGNSGIAFYVYFLSEPEFSSETPYLRYKVDSNSYQKTFPNLVDRNWYRLDDLNITTQDSYIGMHGSDDVSSLTAIILSNTMNSLGSYKYVYITNSKATDLSLIEDYWLYYIDYSDVTNENISYVVEFIESDAESISKDSINKIIVRYHEFDATAHKEDLLYFPSDKHVDSIMSKNLEKFITSPIYHTKTSVRTSSHSGNMFNLGSPVNITTSEYTNILNGFSESQEISDNNDWYNFLVEHYETVRKEDFDYMR